MTVREQIENLLKNKPTEKEFFDSVKVSKDFWKSFCEEQNTLVEKQKKKLQNLIPDSVLYKQSFNV